MEEGSRARSATTLATACSQAWATNLTFTSTPKCRNDPTLDVTHFRRSEVSQSCLGSIDAVLASSGDSGQRTV